MHHLFASFRILLECAQSATDHHKEPSGLFSCDKEHFACREKLFDGVLADASKFARIEFTEQLRLPQCRRFFHDTSYD
jgi:hypothetical protein